MNEVSVQAFRERLMQGHAVIGSFMKTCDPAFIEAAGWAGMDFVILDTEHGPISIQNLQNNIRAAQIAGVFPVVRIANISEEAVGKALDVGAAAIEVPQIRCAEDAKMVLRLSKYHPLGERGLCRFVRAAHYSNQSVHDYFKSANATLTILQLEGTKAISNLDEILMVDGIDIIFIGPYDLSQSLGLPGQTTHPLVIEQMKFIIKEARRKQIAVGTFVDSPETLKLWLNAGVQYIAYSVDVGLFTNACQQIKEYFNKIKRL